jgi:hypothetical protein
LQDLRCAACQHSTANFHPVIQFWVIQHLENRADSARLRIVRAINQPADAGVNQRSRTHGARFNCNKQFALAQSMVADGGAGVPEGNDFRVGRGIVVGKIAIPSSPNHTAVTYDHCSDGDFFNFKRPLRTPQRFFHVEFVGSALRI